MQSKPRPNSSRPQPLKFPWPPAAPQVATPAIRAKVERQFAAISLGRQLIAPGRAVRLGSSGAFNAGFTR